MTGEEAHDQNDKLDDDFFVLSDEDATNPANPDAQTPAASAEQQQAPPTGVSGDEEDILFTPTEAQQKRNLTEPAFGEDAASRWGGAELTAEQIGIETSGSVPAEKSSFGEDMPELEISDVELEIEHAEGEMAPSIDAESELPEPEAAADTGFRVAGMSEQLAQMGGEQQAEATDEPSEDPVLHDSAFGEAVPSDQETTEAGEQAPQDDAWAPAAEETVSETAAETAVPEAAELEPALVGAGTETNFADASETTHVVGAGNVRPLRRRGLMSLAAAALVIAGAGIVFVKPEWVGLGGEPEVTQRADIPRPKAVEQITPPTPPPVVVKADPKPVVEPPPVIVKADPKPPVEPVVTPPVEPVPPVAQDTEPPAMEQESVNIGDSLLMRLMQVQQPKAVAAATLPNGIVAGSQAFVQMHNGNFFVGSVKAVDAEHLTLRMEKGEITLGLADLKALFPIASTEFQELKKVQQGFVRLTNRNRLHGAILQTQDDHVVLEMKSNRIVIPRQEIEELGQEKRTGVHLADEEDDSWVTRLLDRLGKDPKQVPQARDEAQPEPGQTAPRKKLDRGKVQAVTEDPRPVPDKGR